MKWWMTDPNGPAFTAATKAMKAGFEEKPVAIGCGGTIGFVGPLADLLARPGSAPGNRRSVSNAHAPNESLHEGDFRKLTASLAHYSRIWQAPRWEGKVTGAGAVRPRRSAAFAELSPSGASRPRLASQRHFFLPSPLSPTRSTPC